MAANEYVSFHNAVFQSEKATSYRNYALSYYLKEKNVSFQIQFVIRTIFVSLTQHVFHD